VLLCVTSKLSKIEIKKTIPFIIGKNYFTIEVQNAYNEKYKILMKEIKENTKTWKGMPYMDWNNQYC
jgi:prephenate dehydratase